MRSLRVLLALVSVALVSAGAARAEIVTAQDAAGRPITFDVHAPGVDVEWYAALLRGALHGDEISGVTIHVVAPPEIAQRCGSDAAACYERRSGTATIVVPAGQSDALAHTFLHEYGHHVDATLAVEGVREPNGTPRWFAARGMAKLLASGEAFPDYRRGWDRSVAEVFAEDYAQLHVPGPFNISWLAPPSEAVRSALRQDLGAEPAGPPAPAAEPQRVPLVLDRSGRLRPGRRQALEFGLLGPNRRVTYTATVSGHLLRGVRARVELVCDGRRVAVRAIARGQRSVTLDRRRLGPAECSVAVRNTSRSSLRYSVRLRLAVEA